MPVALEHRVVLIAVRGLGIWSALVAPQHVTHGAELYRPL